MPSFLLVGVVGERVVVAPASLAGCTPFVAALCFFFAFGVVVDASTLVDAGVAVVDVDDAGVVVPVVAVCANAIKGNAHAAAASNRVMDFMECSRKNRGVGVGRPCDRSALHAPSAIAFDWFRQRGRRKPWIV